MNKPQDIIQNIIIRIQEDLKNANKAIDYLKNINTAAGKATKTIDDYAKTTTQAVKSISLMQKSFYVLGAAIKTVVAPFSVLLDAIKLIIPLGAGFATMMADAGKELTAFAASSGKGSDAVIKLRDSYQNLLMSGQKVVITIKDVATALTEFGKQGFAQLSMTGEKETQSFIANFQNTLSKGLGSTDLGSQLTQSVTQAFGDNITALKSFEQAWISAGNDLAKQQESIAKFRWIDDQTMMKAIGSIQNLRDQAAGMSDPAISANLTWSEFGNQLLVILNQIQQEITKAFGTDVSGLVEKLSDKIKDITKWTQDAWKEFKIWGAVGKVTFNWISEGAIIAFKLIQGSFQNLISIILSGFSKISKYTGFEDISKRAAAAAKEAAKDSKDSFDRAFSPQFTNMTDELAKAMQETNAQAKKMEISALDTQKTYDTLSLALNKIRDQMLPIIQESKNWKDNLDQSSGYLHTISQLLELVGNDIKINGRNLKEMATVGFGEVIKGAKNLIDKNKQALELSERQLKLARQRHDDTEINKILAERKEIITNIFHAHQAIKNAQEDSLSSNKSNLSLLQSQKDLQQSYLEISKALYGTPALGVESMRNIVNLMQQEKDQLNEMLKIQKQNIANMVAQGIEGNDLLNAKKLELDLQKQIADKTTQQLQMLKELRDGYLDAVTAQALGAGKFEKIIITQEQNIGKALEKGIAKRNYLLGQVGSDAAVGNKNPFRFSATGIGNLENLNGQALNASEYAQNSINNIADPAARAASQQGLNSITGIYGAQIRASTTNTEALQKNTDALNDFINARSRALPAGALKGTPSGNTLQGEAVRRAFNQTPTIAVPQKSAFKTNSSGLVLDNLLNPKSANDIKKIREENSKAMKSKLISKKAPKSMIEGIRKHWEAHSKYWNDTSKSSSDLSSLDTIGKKTDSGYKAETKTGTVLTHGKKTGGGTFSNMMGSIGNLLMNAGQRMMEVGSVIDDIDTKDNPVHKSPTGSRGGEFGQFGAP